MKKFLLFAFPTLFFTLHSRAQSRSFLQQEPWNQVWNQKDEAEEEEESGKDPGWYEQYYEMKKNAEGKIPRLPYAAIEAQKEKNASLRDVNLFNVQEMGPRNYGGRTRAILLDRDNPDEIFAGSVSGGIFHSIDSGAHWTVVNDQLSCLAISCLSQDYYNHNIIYAGTGEGWGNADGVIGNGVYRSTDHGATFSQLPSTDADAFNWIMRVEPSPDDTGMVYVGTSNAGLYRSENYGDSMHLVFATYGTINDIEITPSGGVWVGVHSKGIYYSASGDSGTFTQVTNGLPSLGEFHRIEMAIAPSDTNVMYAAFENSSSNGVRGIFRTDDGGLTWNEKANPDNFGYYLSQSWYSMCIAVKSDDPDFFLFGIGDLVYSSDGGNSYHAAQNLHVDHHVLVFNPANPTRFYLGEDGGIFRLRVDELYTNFPLDPGYSTIQQYAGAYFPTGINAIAGSQDNGTHRCLAGDSANVSILGGDGAYCAVNQQYPNICYASYQNGSIQRADDANFQNPTFYPATTGLDADFDGDIDDGAWFINPFDIDLVNGDYMGFVTLKRYWQSLDGGYSWYPATDNFGTSPFAIGISRAFNPIVYVGGANAILKRLSSSFYNYPGDEVNLSTLVPASITNDFISCITVHPYDSSVFYMTLSNYSTAPRIWKVTNATTGNPTFTSVSGDLPANLPVNYVDVDPLRPDSFLLAATDLGLYVSEDGGTHWVHNDDIPNVFIEQVKVRASDRRVFIFTHGRGGWTGTLDPNIVGVNPVAGVDIPVSVFPNPCNDVLRVRSSANRLSMVMFDMSGQVVMGEKEISGDETIDMSPYAPGVYFCRINDGTHTVMKKVVKAGE